MRQQVVTLAACAFAACTSIAPGAFAMPTILMGGDDDAMVTSVAAELRAAGYTVRLQDDDVEGPNDVTAVVALWRDAEGVVLKVHLPERAGVQRLAIAPDDSGLTPREATALRVAEAVRSLVSIEAPVTSVAVDVPPAPPPPAYAVYSPDAPYPPGYLPPITPAPRDAADDAAEQPPLLRLGLSGGAGYALPMWLGYLGLSLRGQVEPTFNVGGSLHGMVTLGETKYEMFKWEGGGATAAFWGAWEPLGADHSWTPSFGGGVRAELLYLSASPLSNNPFAFDPSLDATGDGAGFGLGPFVRAGLSFSRPWRFRLDVEGGYRLLGAGLDGGLSDLGMTDLVPTINLMLGVEYEIIQRDPDPSSVATRSP